MNKTLAWIELLKEQLAAALATEDPHPTELAVLAGLLARHDAEMPPEVLAWRESPQAEEVRRVLATLRLPELLESTMEKAEQGIEFSFVERVNALESVNEICAAAVFLGCAEALAFEVDLAARDIRTWPTAWAPLAPLALATLETLPDTDLSRPIWREVYEAGAGTRARWLS